MPFSFSPRKVGSTPNMGLQLMTLRAQELSTVPGQPGAPNNAIFYNFSGTLFASGRVLQSRINLIVMIFFPFKQDYIILWIIFNDTECVEIYC